MKFSQLDVDPIQGVEIMGYAGITEDDLVDPKRFGKVRDIISFFQNAEDRRYIISKVLKGKPGVDPVNHLWEYVMLRKDLINKETEIETLTSIPEFIDKSKIGEGNQDAVLSGIREAKLKEVEKIKEELSIYEK